MGLSQLGAVPQNQLDALPLISAVSAANGGTVSLSPGGQVTRFWDATSLGISGVSFTTVNGFVLLVSSFISTFGCRSFMMILSRTNAVAAGGTLAGIDARIQYRLSTTDVPPTNVGTVTQNTDYTGSTSFGTALITFPTMAAIGEVQRALRGFDPGYVVGFAGSNVMAGDQVRIFLNIGSGADPGANEKFSLQLWGIG
jgi:hypothetical protein